LKTRKLSQAEIYQKITRYCAYQERCRAEVILKLKGWEQSQKQIDDFVEILEKEGFINEERYAASYVRGKFRSNKWGRNKIREGLYAKRIPKTIIETALLELEDENYRDQLKHVLQKKDAVLMEEDSFKRKQKLALYAQSKGYELDLIWKVLKEINIEDNNG